MLKTRPEQVLFQVEMAIPKGEIQPYAYAEKKLAFTLQVNAMNSDRRK